MVVWGFGLRVMMMMMMEMEYYVPKLFLLLLSSSSDSDDDVLPRAFSSRTDSIRCPFHQHNVSIKDKA